MIHSDRIVFIQLSEWRLKSVCGMHYDYECQEYHFTESVTDKMSGELDLEVEKQQQTN